MNSGRETGHPDDAGIEELLREVGARDEPSADMTQEVLTAVHAEWQALVQERRRRRRATTWGIAASFAVVLAAATFGLRLMQSESMPIATVAHIDGHLLADAGNDVWDARALGQPIAAGETIQTDDRSRAALTLTDGVSLRLDHNTTLRLASADRVVLGSGALYIDSPTDPSATGFPNETLVVQAHAGSVRHIGTQYQVRTHADALEVSVREGRVEITGASGKSTGEAGESVRMTSNGEVTRTSISPQDPGWHWVMSAASAFDIDDRPLSSFLSWVARETGRKVIYSSAEAQAAAAQVKLRGSIAGLEPDAALAAVLSTTQLRRYETKAEFIGIALASPTDSPAALRPTP